MHAESLVRAENQPQPAVVAGGNDSAMMMDLTRDGTRANDLVSPAEVDASLPR